MFTLMKIWHFISKSLWMKFLVEEIFATGLLEKCNPKNYTRKTYGNITDYILFYTKSDTYVWETVLLTHGQKSMPKENMNI